MDNKPSPSDCIKCGEEFTNDSMFQSMVMHIAIKYGDSAAVSEFNETMEEIHIKH